MRNRQLTADEIRRLFEPVWCPRCGHICGQSVESAKFYICKSGVHFRVIKSIEIDEAIQRRDHRQAKREGKRLFEI